MNKIEPTQADATPYQNDSVWARFYRDGKTLGEIAAEFGGGIYSYYPWLIAPLRRSASEPLMEQMAEALARSQNLLEPIARTKSTNIFDAHECIVANDRALAAYRAAKGEA